MSHGRAWGGGWVYLPRERIIYPGFLIIVFDFNFGVGGTNEMEAVYLIFDGVWRVAVLIV